MAKNLLGLVVGKLTVIARAPNYEYPDGKLRAMWFCTCSCGSQKITKVRASHLIGGRTKSCGCAWAEASFRRRGRPVPSLRRKGAAANAIYARYRGQAKERGIAFDLDKSQFLILISKSCAYCGAPPNQVKKSTAGEICIYSGIDRVKNDLGYDENNCVSCCGLCNQMKMDISLEDWLAHIDRIKEHIAKCPPLLYSVISASVSAQNLN